MAEVKKEEKKNSKKTEQISMSILLVLGIVVLVVGMVFLLKGNNKANSTSYEKLLETMKELKSYSVEFKITNGESFTSEYLLDVDNEHNYTKYQFINRELVMTNYIAYLDYNKGNEYYLSEYDKSFNGIVLERQAKLSDIFERLEKGTLSSYKDGVYTITLSKEDINSYNINHETLLYELMVIDNKTEVTSADVNYLVTIENKYVKSIEFKVGDYTLTYNFSNYNNAEVKLPEVDTEGNIIDQFVDEFSKNHPELVDNEPYVEEPSANE